MDKYKETFQTWNKVADLYQDKFMDLDLYNETYDFLIHSIPKHQAKLLEIGCGPGNISKYFLSVRPDFEILGIDVAPKMIKLAKKNNPTAKFVTMDVRRMDELKEKFDGIVCGFCLPYLSETDSLKLMKDSYHLLNENGFLYLSFVEGEPSESGYQIGSSGDRTYFYYHVLENLKAQLLAHQFEAVKIFKILYEKSKREIDIHTILIAKKTTTRNHK